MRAPFIHTDDIIRGPGHVDAGDVYATVECRNVPELAEFPTQGPLMWRVAYVTMQGTSPLGPAPTLVGQVYSLDFDMADRIAVPSGTDPLWVVLFTERVYWRGEDYYRAHIAPLIDGGITAPLAAGLRFGVGGEPAAAGLRFGTES